MLSETCSFYIKNYVSKKKQQNKTKKQIKEHKDCYCLKFFLVNIPRKFRDFCGLGHINEVISFPMSCRIVLDIGFWWKVGSRWVNISVSFIYILYQ